MSGEQYCDKCKCEYDGYEGHKCPYPRDMAVAHWGYTGEVVAKANRSLPPDTLALMEYLYVEAFVHGWKHCAEEQKGEVAG